MLLTYYTEAQIHIDKIIAERYRSIAKLKLLKKGL